MSGTQRDSIRISRWCADITTANRIAAEWRQLRFKNVRVRRVVNSSQVLFRVSSVGAVDDFAFWLGVEARWDQELTKEKTQSRPRRRV